MRFLAMLLVAASLLFSVSESPAQANTYSYRFKQCKYQTLDGHMGWTDKEVKKTIWCAVQHFGVPGGTTVAFCYASHESGFNEFAKNPYSSASGVYQVIDTTWYSWVNDTPTLTKAWGVGSYVFNARNNVLRSLKEVSRHGWGPWRDYAPYYCG